MWDYFRGKNEYVSNQVIQALDGAAYSMHDRRNDPPASGTANKETPLP